MSIRTSVATLVLLGALTGLSGCDKNPLSPSKGCETNNTASVSFENKSTTNSTYDIVWDGAHITTVAPGQTSKSFDVAAGVLHTLQFQVTNKGTQACTISTPTYAQCSTHTVSCSG